VDPTVSSKSSSGYPTRYSGHRASHIPRAPSARYPVLPRTSSFSRARHAQFVPFHLCSAGGNDGMSATLETAVSQIGDLRPRAQVVLWRNAGGSDPTVIVLEATMGPKIIDAEGGGKPNCRQWPSPTPRYSSCAGAGGGGEPNRLRCGAKSTAATTGALGLGRALHAAPPRRHSDAPRARPLAAPLHLDVRAGRQCWTNMEGVASRSK
jgi:hypothetical protein